MGLFFHRSANLFEEARGVQKPPVGNPSSDQVVEAVEAEAFEESGQRFFRLNRLMSVLAVDWESAVWAVGRSGDNNRRYNLCQNQV